MIEIAKQRNSEKKDPYREVKTYSFLKEEGQWFMYIPGSEKERTSKHNVEMVEGAHKLLNTFARGRNKLLLRLSTQPFDGAFLLELIEHCEAPEGGAIYHMNRRHGKEAQSRIWICDLALLIFGDMPDKIYVQRLARLRS